MREGESQGIDLAYHFFNWISVASVLIMIIIMQPTPKAENIKERGR
jgi:hypothetical protein